LLVTSLNELIGVVTFGPVESKYPVLGTDLCLKIFAVALHSILRDHSVGLILKWEQTRGPNPSMKGEEL
jgi:hypothetical protein